MVLENEHGHNLTNISYQVSRSSSDAEHVYVVLTAVTSSLSIIGGSTICILYIGFRDMRTTSRTLLFFLALSDALLALGNLLGVIWFLYSDSKLIHRNHGYCAFQSAMTIYFSCTSFFWTVTMALNLFNAVVLRNASFAATYMKLFHLLAWIPPGIIVIVALSMDVLGTDTSLEQASWCWIDTRTSNVLVWQFATGKIWEIMSYITVVVLYTAVKVALKNQELKRKTMVGPGTKTRSRKDVIAEANRKLTFVPLVFIVCRIWGTLRFLLGNFAVDYINEPYVTWINPLQGIGDSVQGFANCVLYCLSTEKIRIRLARVMCPKRFMPKPTSDTGNASYTKYSKPTKVGVAGVSGQAFTDVNRFQEEQCVCVVDGNIDQSTSVTTDCPRNKPGQCDTYTDITVINQLDITPSLSSEETNTSQLKDMTTDNVLDNDKSHGDLVRDMFCVTKTNGDDQHTDTHCIGTFTDITDKSTLDMTPSVSFEDTNRTHQPIDLTTDKVVAHDKLHADMVRDIFCVTKTGAKDQLHSKNGLETSTYITDKEEINMKLSVNAEERNVTEKPIVMTTENVLDINKSHDDMVRDMFCVANN